MLTVVGRFLYQNANNNWMGTRWTTVYIYDVEPLGNWDYLGSVLTDSTGGFTFGPINNDDGLGQNGLDIIVVFSTTSSAAEVIDADDDIYQCQTQEYTNCPDGTLDIGSQGCPSSQYGAWRIFTYITDGWNYLSNGPANYEMTKSTAKWPYEDWPHYHTGGEIHIPGDGDSDRSPDVIQHEYAHNVMYVIYGGWWPPNAGGEHTIRRISNVNMAWTEGWAEFFPMASQNDPWFTWVNHYTINLETPTWGTPNWDNGDAVEGRVAGALYDIFDSQNDGYDRFSDGFTRIWNTISSQADGRYSEFFQAWISKGYSQSTFVATAYQNTIDYDNVYPSASITKPKSGYLYVNDIEVGSTGTTNTIIIGDIIIKASASDAGGIYKVEFYIDGQLKYTDWDSSYEWKWTPSVGQHTIKVTAYDNAGQSTSRTINVIAAGTGDLGISFDNNYNTSFLLRGDLVSIQMEDVLLINRDEIADN
ncbi:MAG: hypothetical protein CVT48_06120 [Thermoplasmata archaeon HGW-Thermoplasmata-1]|nr:MAG: hypothetical protein CVT48_06120 [Thermoplasmata archaeon HGW-Thermoplasmata-1]